VATASAGSAVSRRAQVLSMPVHLISTFETLSLLTSVNHLFIDYTMMKLASGEWHEVPAIREILKWSYRRKSLDSPLTSVSLEDCEDELTDIWATYLLEHYLAIKFERTTMAHIMCQKDFGDVLALFAYFDNVLAI
jgi:hypothetical protein